MTNAAEFDKIDVIGLGEVLVQFNAVTSGPLRHVSYFEKHVAGAEANVTVCVRRQGLSSGLVTKLGDDEFGRFIYNWLRGEGVDVSQIKFDSEAFTGIYFIQRGFPIPGRSSVIYYRRGSAASRIDEHDIDPEYFRKARILHLTGITPALSDSLIRASRKAIDIVKKNEGILSFDTNIRPKLWKSLEDARRILLPYLEKSDILFTSIEDSKILIGEEDPKKIIDHYLSIGIDKVVLKLGERGAIASTRSNYVELRGYKVNVVDPIGAGDALAGTFLSGLLKGYDIEKSLHRAIVAGTLVVTVRGDQENLPTEEEIEAFLKSYTKEE